jgi:hypothetical protein
MAKTAMQEAIDILMFKPMDMVSQKAIAGWLEACYLEKEKQEIIDASPVSDAVDKSPEQGEMELLRKKIEFYREQTDNVRQLVFNSQEIGEPCQPLYDAICDKINSQKSEIERLKLILHLVQII